MLVSRGEEGEQDDDYEEITGSEVEFGPQVSCLKFKYMLSAESFNGHFFSLLNENTSSSTIHIPQLLMFFLMSDQKKKKKEMLFGFMIVVPVSILKQVRW